MRILKPTEVCNDLTIVEYICKCFCFVFIGHFTQIVWKNTSEMGIAMAKRDGTCVIVACYHPRGNIVGQFTENVLKPVKTTC